MRVLGIALFIISVQGLIRGIVPWFSSGDFNFILPFGLEQYALFSYIVILIIGLVLISKTKKFDNE
ncbi:hypothetical protein CN601_04265 [Bacillus sp. AFS017336]|nr:hypothetical protein CN601_04265 [Bacillus sp. AFS017336]